MAENIKSHKEIELSLREYLEILSKRKNLLVIISSLTLVAGLIFNLFIPLKYKATATVMVGPSTIQVRTISGNIITQRYEAQNELEVMKSDSVIKKTVELIEKEIGAGLKISQKDIKDDILTLEVQRDKRGYMSNIINLSATSTDPRISFLTITGIINSYIENSKTYNKRVIDEAYETATKELAKIRKDLEEAERTLTKFVLEHDIIARGIEVGLVEEEKDEKRLRQPVKTDEPRINEKYLSLKSKRIDRESFLEEIKKHREEDETTTLSIIAKREEKLVDFTLRDTLYEKERDLSKLLLTQSDLHPDVIEARGEVEEAKKRISIEIEKAINSLERDVESLKIEETKLYTLIKEGLSDTMVEYSTLKRNVEVKKEIYNTFVKQLQELNLTEKLQKIHPIDILAQPVIPIKPANPHVNNVPIIFLLSLFMGVGAVLFIESMDATIKNVEDAENVIGVPVLATVPRCKNDSNFINLATFASEDREEIISEAFRIMRTNIKFVGAEKKIKSFIITSAGPEEGKSTISLNLAYTMAKSGEKVVLIDADLRRPVLHKYFNLENSTGFSDLLTENTPVGDVPVNDIGIENLKLITSGRTGSKHNLSKLLEGNKTDILLKKLRESYDIVIMDSSPILAVADSLILASKMEGIILVVSANRTMLHAVHQLKNMFKNARLTIMGTVVNMLEFRKGGYYSGYYYYNYEDYNEKR